MIVQRFHFTNEFYFSVRDYSESIRGAAMEGNLFGSATTKKICAKKPKKQNCEFARPERR